MKNNSELRAAPSPQGCFLPVLYEDEDILILHKHSGVPSVPHSSTETNTAVNAALAHFPNLSQVGDNPLEAGALHRLDTGTSGILVFAKKQEEFIRLREAWKKRKVKKIYRALVDLRSPPPPKIPYRIDFPLAHDAKSSKRMIALVPNKPIHSNRIRGNPRPAVTWIRKVSGSDFEIEIETGVLHQIRCHLAALGWPIWGDPLYFKAKDEKIPPFRQDRLWLHAWRLQLPLKNAVSLTIESDLPEGWIEGHRDK